MALYERQDSSSCRAGVIDAEAPAPFTLSTFFFRVRAVSRLVFI